MGKEMIHALILFTLITIYQKVIGLQCYVPGECSLSPTIDVIYHEDYNSCLKESKAYNASWFTFDPDGNVCELFSSCTNLTTYYCDQCISGEMDCEPILCDAIGQCNVCISSNLGFFHVRREAELYFHIWFSQCFFQGILVTHLIKPSRDLCLKACKSEDLCSYYSFNAENGFCLLFKTCPLFDETDTDYVSGNVICDYNDFTCKYFSNHCICIYDNSFQTSIVQLIRFW